MTDMIEKVDSPEFQVMNFHGDDILTTRHNGEPYVAMRRIVENLSIDWASQFRKLNEQGRKFNCCHITTVGDDGKQREMLCMPVNKLALWLATINPNKIKDDQKREKIEWYQERSAIALHEYWTQDVAVRSDMDGVVTDLDPRVLKVLGGIMKGIVHKEMGHVLPAMVQSFVAENYLTIAQGMNSADILDMAGVHNRKGLRGLAQKVSNAVRKYCNQANIPPHITNTGSVRVYTYPPVAVKNWLENGGRDMIRRWVEEKRGQGVLKLVTK